MLRIRIMRGLPGSGKSFFANNVLPAIFNCSYSIYSADYFFTDENGNYDFDPKGLPEAHRQCRSGFLDDILKHNDSDEDHLVIVDNTNTVPTEMAFYHDLATIYTRDVEILTISPPTGMKLEDWLEQCHQQNQHGVPKKSIKDMARRINNNKIPWYWKEKVVTREDGFFTLNGQRHDVAVTNG